MPDDLIFLPEFAKGHADALTSGLIEQFAEESDVARACPFKSADKGLNVFDRETSEPTVAYRALNEDPEISHGTEEQFHDACYPISGLLSFDRVKLKRYGERKRLTYMKGQMKKGSRIWTDTFINGDTSTNPREPTGLQRRLSDAGTGSVDGTDDASRLIVNNVASGGGPLSLSQLDIAIQQTANANAILMPRLLKTRMIGAMRDINVSGHVLHMEQEGGRSVLRYGGIPILQGYEVSKDSQFLPFNEVGFGGGAAITASIYVVSFREDGVCGIQTDVPEIVPIGNTDRGVQERDLFEWDQGLTIEDYYSAMRLSSITNAAIVQ